MNKTKAIKEIRRIFRSKRKLAEETVDIDDADAAAHNKVATAGQEASRAPREGAILKDLSRGAGRGAAGTGKTTEENLHNRREADPRQFHDGAITGNRPEPVIRLLGALSRLFPSTDKAADIDDTDIDPRTKTPRDKKRARKHFQDGDHHARTGRLKAEPDPLEPRPFKYTSTELLIPNLIHVAVIFLAVVFLLLVWYEHHIYPYDPLTGQRPGLLDSVVPSTPDDTQPPPHTNPNAVFDRR
jgi:hypothetical protein